MPIRPSPRRVTATNYAPEPVPGSVRLVNRVTRELNARLYFTLSFWRSLDDATNYVNVKLGTTQDDASVSVWQSYSLVK
jgi:hypothetical protein